MTLERSRSEACLSDLWLDRLDAGELSPAEERRAQEHLPGCAACAARLAAIETHRDRYRAALPPAPVLPTLQELSSAATTGAAAPAVEEASAGTIVATTARARAGRRVRILRWSGAATAASMAAAVAVLVLRPWAPADDQRGLEGQARTASGIRTKGGESLGFYIERGERVIAGASGDIVHPGDSIGFTYTSNRSAFLVVAGVDRSGRVSIYHPSGPRAEPIGPGTDQDLPDSIRLDGVLGTEVVHGFFCSSPVGVDAVRAALESGAGQVLPGCRDDRLILEKRAR